MSPDNAKAKKVFIIFGTRPEAIKLAPVIKLLKQDGNFDVFVCVLRQHKEVPKILSLFDIKPDAELGIELSDRGVFSGNPFKKILALIGTGFSFFRLFRLLGKKRPDMILVHGDTSTAFLMSFVAFNKKIPVGHVEAGLRTHNKYAPFPEEMNRQLIGRIADCHFAPTEEAKNNLLKENIDEKGIFVVGNTGIDAVKLILNKENGEMKDVGFGEKFILVTAHRRESFGEGMKNICEAIKEISKKHKDINIVYPVHHNPNVRKTVFEELKGIGNVHLIPPADYETFIRLMKDSYLILTDSGGIQEEVSVIGKPCLVMREVTERQEGIDEGTVKLVGTDKEKIVSSVDDLLEDKDLYKKMSKTHTAFGDGHASERILKAISDYLELK